MNKLQTKHNEVIIKTSTLEEIKDKYLAERLLRTWNEDFIDEDTGETVSIERNEIIFDKGTLILNDELSQINFYLQSGDIKKVAVSNQKRIGHSANGYTSVWSVTVRVYKKKKTYFLYANSIQLAIKIITDYLEQTIDGAFVFTSIKEIDYSNLIPIQEDSDGKEFYKTEVEVTYEDEEPINRTYILQANDAEQAKELIVNFITIQLNSEKKNTSFETTIISAKNNLL